MPEVLWWFLIGVLQILRLLLVPAIPVVVWVLWEWHRQDTAGLGDAECRACREPVSPSDEPAHQGAVRYGGRGMCSRCYQKAKYQRRKRAHS